MLLSFKNNLYLSALLLGTMIAISSSSWFSCWLGLEINLMSLVPLIINKMNPLSSETSIKYFINQALASVIIIFSASFLFFKNPNNFIEFNQLILTIAMGMKIGAAPLHFWLPQVVQTSEWPQIILILTWQKIAPMCLMMSSSNPILYLLIFFSCLVGVAGAINQTSIKKIMVYSSIIHSAWMMTAMIFSSNIWWLYFILYSSISISIMIPLCFAPLVSLKQLFTSFFPLQTLLIFSMNFFSLGGIPPFLGFFMKIITLISMLYLGANIFLLLILIISSLMALFFYTRVIFSSSLLSLSKNSLNFNSFSSKMSSLYFVVISIFMNLCCPLLLLTS